jgi:hypothetical protein
MAPFMYFSMVERQVSSFDLQSSASYHTQVLVMLIYIEQSNNCMKMYVIYCETHFINYDFKLLKVIALVWNLNSLVKRHL